MTTASFTGTRNGMTPDQKRVYAALLRSQGITLCLNGDCIGADGDAQDIYMQQMLKFELYPAFNLGHPNRYGKYVKQAGVFVHPIMEPLVRDKIMVEESKILMATPKSYGPIARSGTWTTIRHARKLERPIIIIYPNGRMQKENFEIHSED